MTITWDAEAPWPPAQVVETESYYTEAHTWYVGEPAALRRYYSNTYDTVRIRPSQRQGGLVGWVARMFWGIPATGALGDMEQLHIPAAANLSALSADLLYVEPPKITVEGSSAGPVGDRLQEILTDGGAYSVYGTAAEYASAYGSAYIRHTVDRDIAGEPIAEAMPPHCAIPEWRAGRLAAVTFWRRLDNGSKTSVLRHLERHEPGMIQHQLREGTDDKLGKVIPLSAHQETRRLAGLVNSDGVIETGIPILDVVHQANVVPNSLFPGTPLGRSDYWGAYGSMAALDETWSLWMDALRLARPRLVVPEEYTRGLGPGKGSTFDPYQRIFTAVRALDPAQPLQIEQIDFTINTDQYDRTAAGLWRNIVRNAGLSADAFGEEASGQQATATEIGQRGARTVATRARKADQATVAARRSSQILLAYDAAFYGGRGGADTPVRVQFADGVTPDPKKDAEVVQLLDAAGKISLRTGIAMAHPDWDDDQIEAEALAIEDERAASAPTDPGTFDGSTPFGAPTDGATVVDQGVDANVA